MTRFVKIKNSLVLLLVVAATLVGGSAEAAIYTWIGGNSAWTTSTNWSPTRTSPALTDTLQFNNGGTNTVTAVPAGTIRRLVVTNNTNISLQAGATGTLLLGYLSTNTNVLTVSAGSTLQLSSTGAIVHTLAFTNLTGSSTNIAGNLVINANTGLTNTVNFANLTAANNVITGTITNNGGVVTAATTTTTFGAGSFYTHARNGGAIPTATWNATSTVNVTGITNTALTDIVAGQNFGNFTWNSSSIVATALAGAGSFTISGALNVNAGNLSIGTMALAANNLTVSGTATIALGATLSFTSVTGNRLFNGNFINNGTFTNSINEAVTFGGNFENNGTFTAGTGVYTFTTTGRTISGSSATTFGSITINTPVVITNNSTAGLTVSTALAGTGTLLQGTNAQLIINGTSGITTLTCTTNTPNTVTYGATSAQTVKGTTYHNLVINKASNTATAATGVVINNSFAINSGTFADGGFTVTGNTAATFTMAAGATYQTTKTVAPWFPTNFTTANTTLNNGSTFMYAATTLHTLPLLSTLPITQYPILGIAGAVQKRWLRQLRFMA